MRIESIGKLPLNAQLDRVAAIKSFSQMLIGFTWSDCAARMGKGDLELGAKNMERSMQAGALGTKPPTFTLRFWVQALMVWG